MAACMSRDNRPKLASEYLPQKELDIALNKEVRVVEQEFII